MDQQPGSGTASGETALPETTNDALPATDQAPTTTLPEEIEASNGASRDDDSGRSSVERQELAVPETPGPGDEQAQFAGPDGQFIDISVGAGYVCGLRVDRSVNCWHDHSDGVRVIPTGEPALTAVSAGWDRTCGLRIDSTVACWWGIGHSTSEVFPGLEGRFVALSVGAGLLCGLQTDSSLTCSGDSREAEVPEGRFSAVDLGINNSCGLLVDGSVVCWASNIYGAAVAADVPDGRFSAVSVGWSHSCGLLVDGSVVCWGSNRDGETDAPEGRFSAVSVGWSHSCGLLVDGSVVCWGSNRDGETDAPEGRLISISAGASQTCGLRPDNTVSCWGSHVPRFPPEPQPEREALAPDSEPVGTGREELAPDPALRWTEIGPGIGRPYGLSSVGDGRVMALTDHGEDGGVLVTSDGVHWAELPLPEGIEPLYVNFSGGSWLLSGVEALSVEVLSDDGEPDPDGPRIPLTEFLAQRDPPDTFAERVFFSDDEGITWTELNLDVPELSEQEWPCIEVGLPVTHPEYFEEAFDLAAEGVPWCSHEYSQVSLIWPWAGRIAIAVMTTDLDRWSRQQAETRVFVGDFPGDGSDLELTAQWDPGWIVKGAGTADGLVLDLAYRTGLLASTDGRVWSELSDVLGTRAVQALAGASADGSVWGASSATVGSVGFSDVVIGVDGELETARYELGLLEAGGSSVVRFGLGEAATDVAVLEGLDLDANLALGPAGLAATATPLLVDIRTVFDPAILRRSLAASELGSYGGGTYLSPTGRIVKDRFELRLNEPDRGITLWDLSKDKAVYILDPDVIESGGATPYGVREAGRGESYTLVFDDPQTGDELVTFTMWDLLEVLGADGPQETWVGWSADGAEWEWQTAAAAFGTEAAPSRVGADAGGGMIIGGPPTSFRFAVGGDFVLAYVSVSGEPSRWFIARITP